MFPLSGVLQYQGCNRAYLDACEAIGTRQPRRVFVTQEVHHGVEPSPGKGDQGVAALPAAHKYASPAQDTTVWVVLEQGMPVICLRPLLFDGLQVLRLQWDTEKFGDSLQLTALVGRTVLAVHTVRGEQEP